jgi:hypothetical protein
VHHAGNSVVVLADKVTAIVDTIDDLEPYLFDLGSRFHNYYDIEELDQTIKDRARTLSEKVTRIYGRTDLHIALDLVAHSALWMDFEGSRERGWLDICIIGETRTGKTKAAARWLGWHGMGVRFALENNYTRVGLTMGADGSKKGRLSPGLIPRQHKKLLVLDECQAMSKEGETPFFSHLQEARSDGVMAIAKVYGSCKIPSAVRLVTMGNYPNVPVEFPVQYLHTIYGRPEAISRLDFALNVISPMDPIEGKVIDGWSNRLHRALILRAWSLEPEMIYIEEDAIELARHYCKEWGLWYAIEMPLFTEMEKIVSVLRIAISVANMVFSHPTGKPSECVVKKVHVEWASRWLVRTWEKMQYDRYSAHLIAQREVTHPFEVERHLTVRLDLGDPEQAVAVVSEMFGSYPRNHLFNLLGMEGRDAADWIKTMIRMRALCSDVQWGGNVMLKPTPGGKQIMEMICYLARNYPHVYAHRYQRLLRWVKKTGEQGPSEILPLTVSRECLDRECEKETMGPIVEMF